MYASEVNQLMYKYIPFIKLGSRATSILNNYDDVTGFTKCSNLVPSVYGGRHFEFREDAGDKVVRPRSQGVFDTHLSLYFANRELIERHSSFDLFLHEPRKTFLFKCRNSYLKAYKLIFSIVIRQV